MSATRSGAVRVQGSEGLFEVSELLRVLQRRLLRAPLHRLGSGNAGGVMVKAAMPCPGLAPQIHFRAWCSRRPPKPSFSVKISRISLKPDGDDVDDTTQVKLGVHARRATVDDVH